MVGKKAIGKYTKKQVKKMADDIFGTDKAIKNIGKAKPKPKAKTTKRSEAPIQSERSKITKANAKAVAKRGAITPVVAKTIGKTGGGRTASRTGAAASRPGRGVAAAAIAGGVGLTLMNKKSSSAPAKVTFADAFRKARAKGEGTKFTHDGKKYTAVTKTDLKKKGYDANELAAYNKRGGKARGPLNRLGQGVKKVLLGKDKKFGGDKGVIDFIRKPKKKAAGGMMSPQPMPARSRPPMPPRPPKPRPRRKPRTELIDPRLPRGKVGKGPLEPRDSTTRVISQPPKKKMKFKERIRRDKREQMPSKGSILATLRQTPPPLEKGPGMKAGGSVKKYKAGGTVSKSKATGAAKRGFGKAYMKGKRS